MITLKGGGGGLPPPSDLQNLFRFVLAFFLLRISAYIDKLGKKEWNHHYKFCSTSEVCEPQIEFFWQKWSCTTIRFPGQLRNFVDWIHFMSIQFRRFGSCTTDSSFDFISQHSNLHWRHSNLNLCRSNSQKMQQVRKTVIQFRCCPDRWRIWMLSTRIWIWMMYTLNFLTEVQIWMTEIQIWTTNFMAQIYFTNLNDSFIKWNDKSAKLTGKNLY